MPLEDTGSPSPGTNTQDTGGLANSPMYDEDKHLLPKWLRAILLGTAGVAGAAINIFDDEGVLKDAADDIGDALNPGSEENKELIALIKENFDRQFAFIQDRQEMFNRYKLDLLNTIKDAPDYVIPDILLNTVETLQNYSDEIKDAYISGGEEIKREIERGTTAALSAVYENTNKALSEVESGVDKSNDAYKEAVKEAQRTSSHMRNMANTEFSDSLYRYRNLAEQGLMGFTKLQADALDTFIKGGSDITALAKEVTPKMLEAAEKAAAVYEGKEAEGVVEGYEKGAQAIKDITKQRSAEMGEYSKQAAESKLSGAKGMLDVYGDLARKKELPGQGLIEEKMGSDFANQIRTVRELFAGEAGAQQVVGGISSRLNQQKQDLSIQAAQYRTDRQADFAKAIQQAAEIQSNAYKEREKTAQTQATMETGAEWDATSLVGGAKERMMTGKSGAYSDLVSNLGGALGASTSATATGTEIAGGGQERAAVNTLEAFLQKAGLLFEAESDVTKSKIGTEKAAGEMNIDAWLAEGDNAAKLSKYLSDTYLTKGEMEKDVELDVTDTTTQGAKDVADMTKEGYTTAGEIDVTATDLYTEASDKEFGYEKYNPWAATINYYQGLMNTTDPTQDRSQLMGDMQGFLTALMNANTESSNQTREDFTKAFSDIFKTYSDPSQIMPVFKW